MLPLKNSEVELWEKAWNLIMEGLSVPKHPYSTPVLCSINPFLHPRSRTIVLRNALRDKGKFICYTDKRSQKVRDLKEGSPYTSWTFWSPEAKIQVNAYGTTTFLPEEEARKIFASLPKHSRKSYATVSAPGKLTEDYSDGLPPNWDSLDIKKTNYVAENFCVLQTLLTEMEILLLSRNGHQRLRATKKSRTEWAFQWLVP
jgi:pyridoxamine 5'-phosphate oxidase